MTTTNKLVELCTNPFDVMGKPKIPADAIPVGRPRTIRGYFDLAKTSDFGERYGEILKDIAPEEANAYVLGGGGKINGHNLDWAVQFYRIKRTNGSS